MGSTSTRICDCSLWCQGCLLYTSLERKISSHAYSEPIYTWNGLIVDGVEAYQICHKRGIKFRIKRMYFLSREDAISWICTQQLKREDLTEANRKYVIGKKYDAVKAITARISSENSTTGKGGHTYRDVYKRQILTPFLCLSIISSTPL